MKKYEKMTQDLLDDENLIEYLTKQAMEGWMVKKINYSYMTFIKCKPIHLKFDIDYVKVTHEYQEIIKEQGYKHICMFGGKHIYANEDLNAIDLYNDEETKQMAYLNYYKISNVFYHLLWIMILTGHIWLTYNHIYHKFYRHSYALFLTNTTKYIIILVFVIFLLLHLFSMCHMIYMRSYYKKNKKKELKIKYLKYFETINAMISNIYVSLLPFIICYIFMGKNDLIRLNIIIGLFLFILITTISITYRSKNKLIINIIVMICTGFICLGMYDTNISLPVQSLYYEDLVEDYFIDYSDDFLSSYRMIHIFHNDYYEKCVVSVNENISKEIFKEEVIVLECYSRDGVNKKDYYSYNKAIDNMKILVHESIDEGYYNNEYVVVRKDNLVLSFRIKDSIEEVINYYIEV